MKNFRTRKHCITESEEVVKLSYIRQESKVIADFAEDLLHLRAHLQAGSHCCRRLRLLRKTPARTEFSGGNPSLSIWRVFAQDALSVDFAARIRERGSEGMESARRMRKWQIRFQLK